MVLRSNLMKSIPVPFL